MRNFLSKLELHLTADGLPEAMAAAVILVAFAIVALLLRLPLRRHR